MLFQRLLREHILALCKYMDTVDLLLVYSYDTAHFDVFGKLFHLNVAALYILSHII